VVIPAAGNVAGEVQRLATKWSFAPTILDPRDMSPAKYETIKRAGFAESAAALACSGTVSLELAAAGTPTVIGYKANWLTTRAVKRLAQVDSATLVNLVTGRPVVPEFLFEKCTAEEITPALDRVLNDPAEAEEQRTWARAAMDLLGRGDAHPSERAAQSVLSFLS
jgi:lipid-A-disaccharide synthase